MSTPQRWRRVSAPAVLAAAVLAVTAAPPAAPARLAGAENPAPDFRAATGASAIPGRYIVTLNDHTLDEQGVAARAAVLAKAHRGRVGSVWDRALTGFAVSMSEADARAMAVDPEVAYVQQQQTYHVMQGQSPAPWNLDRIDQHPPALDTTYNFNPAGGQGVHAYVIDTGVRFTHTEFGGRATSGYDFVDNDPDATDCTNPTAPGAGHGTHVSGTIGGTTYGLARKVQIVAVRVYDCSGMGPDEAVINGINWVTSHAIKPAVINLSLGSVCTDESGHPVQCPGGAGAAVVEAEQTAINSGITIVTSAGNDNTNACFNPIGSAPGTITVGATSMGGTRTANSNFGSCVDIWAPGEQIASAGPASDTDTKVRGGTSMAAPHVTGAVALLLGDPHFAGVSPFELQLELERRATLGRISGLDPASPNRLLHTPPTSGSSVALAPNQDGRLNLFGTNSQGKLFTRSQKTVDTTDPTGWNVWTQSQSAGPSLASVGAGTNADGRLQLGALTATEEVWQRQQATVNDNKWFGLFQLDDRLTSVAFARNSNGRLAMVGINWQGKLFYRQQTDVNTMTWTAWGSQFGPEKLVSVAAETNGLGRVEILAVGAHGAVYHTEQTALNANTWDPLVALPNPGGREMSAVAVARNSNGTLELIGTDGALGAYHRTQVTPGNAIWTDWSAIPSKRLLHIAADPHSNGRIQLVGVDHSGAIWLSTQTTTNATTYTAWTTLDGALRP